MIDARVPAMALRLEIVEILRAAEAGRERRQIGVRVVEVQDVLRRAVEPIGRNPLPGNGSPVCGSTIVSVVAEKSPLRIASVGTVIVVPPPTCA